MKNSKDHEIKDKHGEAEVANEYDCEKCGGKHKTKDHGKKSGKREKAFEKAKKSHGVPH